MVMQMYRKPKGSVIDRHVLIELDGDFTDQEIGHLLRKAYENHKAPYEYDDLKKYIKDAVIGKHNSVYLQLGNPTPVAAASVLMPSNTLGNSVVAAADYDIIGSVNNYFGFKLSNSCPNLPAGNPGPWVFITYNNGTAIGWAPTYTTSSLQTLAQSSPYTDSLALGEFYAFPSSTYFVVTQIGLPGSPTSVSPNYLYASYQTSTNPLTLSTYYYWVYPSSWKAATYSYVYFGAINNSGSAAIATPNLVLTFYSTGTFSFTPGTAYITMWQWTYT